jgi:hypothetical protein
MKYYGWLQYGGADLDPPELVWDLEIDLHGWHEWDLKAGRLIPNWDGRTYANYSNEADHVDYPFTSELIPVHSSRLASLISEECPNAVQYLPLLIKNRLTDEIIEGYSIANHLVMVDCLDRERAQYELWTKENLLFWEHRPWLLGSFRTINKFVLRSSQIPDKKLFLLWGWDMVIVREDLKTLMERSGITGGRFHEIAAV